MHQPHISIPLGIVIGLLASSVQSLGLTIQRKSHVLNQFLPEHQQRVEHRRPLWLLGFAIFISSNVLGSLVQIASLPVVILAPLGAVSLLWNAFFARFILGDIFSPWMILGTILIAGGATLIAVFGIVAEPTRSLEDLLALFRRPAFVLYFSILGVGVFGCLVITHIADYYSSQNLTRLLSETSSVSSTPRSATPTISPKPSSESMTTGAAIATERTPLLDPKPALSSPAASLHRHSKNPTVRSIYRTRLLLALSYASFSGVISGMCLLFAKSGVELLLLTLRGHNQFWRWQAWTLVLGLVVLALLQLWYLHKALVLADPTLVCPLAFCFYNLSSIVNGLFYFDQFSLIPPLYLGLVVFGIFVLLAGVWVVTVQSGGRNANAQTWKVDALDGDEVPVAFNNVRDIEGDSRSDSESDDMETRDAINGLGRNLIYSAPLEVETLAGSIHVPPSTSTDSMNRKFIESSHQPSRDFARLLSPSRRISRLRRSTVHTSNEPSSSQHPPYHIPSLNHTHTSYAQISPPLMLFSTASTLGAGFQIGLSPVSPGFAIVPRERGRRSSELGLGVLGSADVVVDTTQARRELQRRRTVSEGDARRGTLVSSHSQSGSEHEEEGSLEGHADGGTDDNLQTSDNRDKGKVKHGKLGWQWLRKAFRGR